jgi:hypothetical protein
LKVKLGFDWPRGRKIRIRMKEIKSKDPLVRRLDLHPTIEARMGQTESPMMNPALLESPIRPTPKPSDPFLKYLTIRIRIEGNANEKPKPAKNLRITRDAKVGASPLRITEIVFTAVPMMTIFAGPNFAAKIPPGTSNAA